MAELNKIPSRRRFLGGLGALFAAPAIVRAEALMPVKVWEPRLLVMEPGGPGDVGWIVREFNRQLYNRIRENPSIADGIDPSPLQTIRQQHRVDIGLEERMYRLNGVEFSAQILAPAAFSMAKVLFDGKDKIRTMELQLPESAVGAARSRVGGIAARAVMDYDIRFDQSLLWFDVGHD